MNSTNNIFSAIRSSERIMDNAVAVPVEANGAEMRNLDVETQIAKLTLVTMAMWQLLREKTGITETELAERVAILDAQDGTADGTLTRKPVQCGKCHRIVERKQAVCLYCGTPQKFDSVFDTI